MLSKPGLVVILINDVFVFLLSWHVLCVTLSANTFMVMELHVIFNTLHKYDLTTMICRYIFDLIV